jgi:hypothetical protein
MKRLISLWELAIAKIVDGIIAIGINNVVAGNSADRENIFKFMKTPYVYPSGQLLIIDVNGNAISAKTEDGKDGDVTLSEDGKVKIDGEYAFLRNDTIFYTVHGAGSSMEVILVRRLNDMH